MSNLRDLFIDELKDMYDAENRISKALPKIAKAADSKELQAALLNHQKETLGQIQKLKEVFAAFDEKPKGKECKATVGLLEEGDEIIEDNDGEPTLDAGIISACQKVEHYEIASYGCLVEWARLLECKQAVALLKAILDQEKNANDTLNKLAREANGTAMQDNEPEEEKPRGKAARAQSKKP